MKIYTIETGQSRGYDIYLGHVIVANDEAEVRQLAKNESADEGGKIWDSAKVTECGDYTCDRTEPFILLSDFNAG